MEPLLGYEVATLVEIRFSTGTFDSSEDLLSRIRFLVEHGVRAIELSGGAFEPNWLATVGSFPEISFSFHNYFPPPKVPFVLNLASNDETIRQSSIELCKEGIRLSASFGQTHYSFHAGFCFDPTPASLGGRLESHKAMSSRVAALELFSDSLSKIMEYSKTLGVLPVVENNVLTKNTASSYGEEALFLTTSREMESFVNRWGGSIGLLVDTGHLRVSSTTLGLNFDSELDKALSLAHSLHLHDNDGNHDQHLGISLKSQMWGALVRYEDLFWTFEVKPHYVSETLESLGVN